jgi:hypothetical protein
VKPDSKEQQTVREYLLGLAPEGDSAHVEEQLLTDDAFYEELLIAEDELIDQYLNAALSPTEHHSFETHFLAAPERHRKLSFARAFHKYLALTTTSESLDTTDACCRVITRRGKLCMGDFQQLASANNAARHHLCCDSHTRPYARQR